MQAAAAILNHLHRAFGTITDVKVLARLRTYDEIGVGPVVSVQERDEIMAAIQKKHFVWAGGNIYSLKADGRAVIAFLNAYRDRYNALYSDMVHRQSEENDFDLRRFIARKIVTKGEVSAKSELIEMSEEIDGENARLVREYRYTRANLVEVLARTFREYDGEKPLIDFVRDRYPPLGDAEKDIINKAYMAAKLMKK